MIPLFFSELNLLTVYLSLLLGLVHDFVLILHLRPLPPDLYHRVEISNLQWEGLWSWWKHLLTGTPLALLTFTIVCSFKHLVAAWEIMRGVQVRLELVALEFTRAGVIHYVACWESA